MHRRCLNPSVKKLHKCAQMTTCFFSTKGTPGSPWTRAKRTKRHWTPSADMSFTKSEASSTLRTRASTRSPLLSSSGYKTCKSSASINTSTRWRYSRERFHQIPPLCVVRTIHRALLSIWNGSLCRLIKDRVPTCNRVGMMCSLVAVPTWALEIAPLSLRRLKCNNVLCSAVILSKQIVYKRTVCSSIQGNLRIMAVARRNPQRGIKCLGADPWIPVCRLVLSSRQRMPKDVTTPLTKPKLHKLLTLTLPSEARTSILTSMWTSVKPRRSKSSPKKWIWNPLVARKITQNTRPLR